MDVTVSASGTEQPNQFKQNGPVHPTGLGEKASGYCKLVGIVAQDPSREDVGIDRDQRPPRSLNSAYFFAAIAGPAAAMSSSEIRGPL